MKRHFEPDPKAMLTLWCTQQGVPPPALVACRVADGTVEVVGSVTLDEERYVRVSHRAAHESDAELEVSRELFVQVQAMVGPIAWPAVIPLRRETAAERLARRAPEGRAAETAAKKSAEESRTEGANRHGARHARSPGGRGPPSGGSFTCITTYRGNHGQWTAQGSVANRPRADGRRTIHGADAIREPRRKSSQNCTASAW